MHNPLSEKRTTYTIDWLTVSFDWQSNYRLYMPQDCFAPTDSKLSPLPAYNRAAKLTVGRLDWHSDKPEQKRLLTFSGRDIANLSAFGIPQREFIALVLTLPKANITRLDFAADIHNGEVVAADVKTLLERGYVSTSAKKSSDIEERIIGEAGAGMTVYIGSRSSTLMLRIYDKGKKEKVGYPWLRIELEAKKERAMMLAKAIVSNEVHTAGCAAIRQYATIGSPEIWDALTGAIEIDLSVGRKLTDWEKWVIEVALPNVAKAYGQSLPDVVNWIASLQEKSSGAGK